jgi:hypothetical protein
VFAESTDGCDENRLATALLVGYMSSPLPLRATLGNGTLNFNMSIAVPMPHFQRLDAHRIGVDLDSGGVQLRYSSDADFEKDFCRMFDSLAALPGAHVESSESIALIWEVALRRLLLLNRGLLGAHEAFNLTNILEDPGVYRSVLAELDRRHEDREQSISELASFFGP